MGQAEAYKFLVEQRKKNDDWFPVSEIEEALKDCGCNNTDKKIYGNLFQLVKFNMIEFKGEGLWQHRKLFRAIK